MAAVLALAAPAGARARAPAARATGAAARSHVTRLEVRGRQALAGGYERVFGVAHGVVAGGEPVRGLPAGGVRYDAEFELLRPRRYARAPRPRMLLVEAENRGSPLLLGALTGFEPTVTGAPSTARHPASDRPGACAGCGWPTRGSSGRRASPPGCPRPRRARARSSCATWAARSGAATRGGRSPA